VKQFGIEARTFDADSAEDLEALIDEKTRVIFFETLSNPQVAIPDIDKIVAIARKHNILTIADNTVATPIHSKPLSRGVDVVIHSASKYICGNGTAIGGIVVEREGLNDFLKGNPRYAHFNAPDESYHGLVYTSLPLPAFTLRIRLAYIRDIGAAISPFNSWLLIQGLETLHIRVREHSQNALKVAQFLESHPKVKSVSYPALTSSKYHDRAQKYFADGLASGLLSFDVGSFEAAKKIANSTKIFSVVVNIGDSKSIITHPASTTHQQLPADELAGAYVTQGLIRLSIGLEDADDLIDSMIEGAEKATATLAHINPLKPRRIPSTPS
jgi:O-acetylhomoserine (thiol)-lyase